MNLVMGCLDKNGNVVRGLSLKEQTRMTMDYIKVILEAGDSSLDYVVRLSSHLTDHALFGDYNNMYKEYFDAPFP